MAKLVRREPAKLKIPGSSPGTTSQEIVMAGQHLITQRYPSVVLRIKEIGWLIGLGLALTFPLSLGDITSLALEVARDRLDLLTPYPILVPVAYISVSIQLTIIKAILSGFVGFGYAQLLPKDSKMFLRSSSYTSQR